MKMNQKPKSHLDHYSTHEIVFIWMGRILFLLFMLLPFIEMFFIAVKPLSGVKTIPYSLLPKEWEWSNYARIWETVPNLARYIFNSFLLGFGVTFVNLLLSLTAAYGFSRFNFRHKNLSLVFLLSLTMLSGVLLLIPLYKLFQVLNMLNTYWPMILAGAISLLPINIWLLKSYLDQISVSLDEASYVDGANIFQIIYYVILPCLAPSMVVLGTRTFIAAYAQQFAFAITFNRKQEFMPITQGLFSFFGRQDVIWNELMAAALIGSLPVILVFLVAQKHIIQGLTAGGVKE